MASDANSRLLIINGIGSNFDYRRDATLPNLSATPCPEIPPDEQGSSSPLPPAFKTNTLPSALPYGSLDSFLVSSLDLQGQRPPFFWTLPYLFFCFCSPFVLFDRSVLSLLIS